MSGSSVAMAALPFHASHSAPDLLLAGGGRALPKPKPPPSSNLGTAPVDRSSPGFKALPPLPGLAGFDIPSFDLAGELEKSFSFISTTTTTTFPDLIPTPPRPATATAATARASPLSARFEIGIANDDDEDYDSEDQARNGLEPPRTRTAATTTTRTRAGAAGADGHARTRSKSMVDRPLSWLPSSKSSPNVRTSQEHRPKRLAQQHVAAAAPESTPAGNPPERSRPESFADFARLSWISKSRSPSPPPTKAEKPRAASARPLSVELPKPKPAPGTQAGAEPPLSSKSRALSRASIYLTKIKQKPQNAFSRSSSSITLKTSLGKSVTASDLECGTPLTQTPASASAPSSPAVAAKNPSYNSVSSTTSRSSSQRAPSVDTELDTDTATASSTSENTSQSTVDTSITMPHPTSRDPLWATYRTLDIEFGRFAAKASTAGRMSVVRSILVPFLRSTGYHPSNWNCSILTSEDMDRRATILNKWWNGLLGMLVGSSSRIPSGLSQGMASLGVQFPVLQPVAGVDRPTLLEATTMIMMRPEWRACTSHFQPLADRRPEERVRPRSGTHSTIASDPDSLLAESAEHNVRTMFIANLTTQMALVVEKLSLRHAPLSLVNWCGKACAYAFFFVPGISDVLVRLWGLHTDVLRRVSEEFGLPRRSKGESDDIVALFPTSLHKLGWTSAKSLGDKLRVAAKLPLMLAKIHWHGPWLTRWRGGDTDLLFIFCKYFYILAQEFMPEGLPLVEKARAPAFVLVHAQLLSVLDSTIHRQASIDAMLGPPLSDALHGADAALTAAQLPSNLLKGMDENRLVILLKDMLEEHSFGISTEIKHTFAEAFVAVAKAATKRTPRFEHASCFMLCDFLEEALVALNTFQITANSSVAASPAVEDALSSDYFRPPSPARAVDYIDWPFWFEVGKMIMNCNNTMSEIRILSFIFSIWDVITADPARKEAVCLDWLLSEETFAKFFNHWCPMVRAYYMRLLCWRICRDAGSANEVDTKIFLVMSQRLKTVWSHYLWLRQDAEAKGRMNPSSAPCYPAPGKRFLIIRTEVQAPQHSLRLGFDSFSSSFPSADTGVDYRSPNGDTLSNSVKADGNGSFKKRWSLLGKVLPFGASQDSPTSETKRTWEEELEQARRETAASRLAGRGGKSAPPARPLGPPTPPKQSLSTAASSDSGSTTSSMAFFEAATFVFRFTLTWQTGPGGAPMPCGPMRDRILVRPRLPAPAQARVSVRLAGMAGVNKGAAAVNGARVLRSESPPPISPGLPPETRRVSGLWQTGLISEARNAKPLNGDAQPLRQAVLTKEAEPRPSLSLSIDTTPIRLSDDDEMPDNNNTNNRLELQSPIGMASNGSGYESDRGRPPPSDAYGMPPPAAAAIRAEKPTGPYAATAVYGGRALAEWSMVVSECNSFVDRRRDEGVLGLSEVEVPTLSVEGLGLRARC